MIVKAESIEVCYFVYGTLFLVQRLKEHSEILLGQFLVRLTMFYTAFWKARYIEWSPKDVQP